MNSCIDHYPKAIHNRVQERHLSVAHYSTDANTPMCRKEVSKECEAAQSRDARNSLHQCRDEKKCRMR